MLRIGYYVSTFGRAGQHRINPGTRMIDIELN